MLICCVALQSSKPQLERQRRARINNSLDELKSLVFSALYQDVSKPRPINNFKLAKNFALFYEEELASIP